MKVVGIASCPSCPLGREVQRDFWSRDLGFNAGATLLPFLLVILTVFCVSRHF
jgi:hypothetical protein